MTHELREATQGEKKKGRLRTSVRRWVIWDRLGNFRELQLVDSYLGNHGPIITHASYPNDPKSQIPER